MKGRLLADLDLLYQLNFAREDNIFQLRLWLTRCFELHRGQRELVPDVNANNRYAAGQMNRLEQERSKIEGKLAERYRYAEIDSNNKNALFSLLSRVQRTIKTFYGRLMVAFPRLADYLNTETCEFQNELRQLVLEKMSGGKRIGEFIDEFQKHLSNRHRKEVQKFIGFYSQYGCLIDKRAEKEEQSLLKLEKYGELLTREAVAMACRYYTAQMNRKGTPTVLTDLYGIEDIEEAAPQQSTYGSTPYLPTKEQSFCQLFAMKMDRTLKELTTRNLYQQRIITRFLLEARVRDNQVIRSAKQPRDKKANNSTQRRFRSNKSVNLRSLSETNDSQTPPPPPAQTNKEPKPVVRQTLLQMNINERAPLPQLSHFRLTEFPQNSFSFYRDKLNKTQLLTLFRKRFPVILKENV